jgi:hypothetical protein
MAPNPVETAVIEAAKRTSQMLVVSSTLISSGCLIQFHNHSLPLYLTYVN